MKLHVLVLNLPKYHVENSFTVTVLFGEGMHFAILSFWVVFNIIN